MDASAAGASMSRAFDQAVYLARNPRGSSDGATLVAAMEDLGAEFARRPGTPGCGPVA